MRGHGQPGHDAPQGVGYAAPAGRGGGRRAGHGRGADVVAQGCDPAQLQFDEGSATRVTVTTAIDFATLKLNTDFPFVWVVFQTDWYQLARDGLLDVTVKHRGSELTIPWFEHRDGCAALINTVCFKAGETIVVSATVSDSDLLTNTAVWGRGAIYATDDPSFTPPDRPLRNGPGRMKTAQASIVSGTAAQISTTPKYVAITDASPGVRLTAIGGAIEVKGYSTNGAGAADSNGITIGAGESIWFPVDDLQRIAVNMVATPATLQYAWAEWRDLV